VLRTACRDCRPSASRCRCRTGPCRSPPRSFRRPGH
jgi:hypothetical protein